MHLVIFHNFIILTEVYQEKQTVYLQESWRRRSWW